MKKYVVILLGLSLICLFVFGSETFARCRGRIFRGRFVSSTCCAPVIAKEVAVVQEVAFAYPILVPAYQFQYVPPTVVTVPAGQAYSVAGYPVVNAPVAQSYGQQPYQSYGQPPQYQQPYQQFNNNNIRELARALIEEMNRITEGGDNQPAVPLTNQPQSQPLPRLQVNNFNSLQYQALASLSKNCSACHTGVGSDRGIIIFSQPGYFNPNVNLMKIKEQIDTGRMPPPKSQYHLTPQEKSTILEWIRLKGIN